MISHIWRGWENLLLRNTEIEQTGIISKKHLYIKKNTTGSGNEIWPRLGKLRKGKMRFSSCSQRQTCIQDSHFSIARFGVLIRNNDPCTLPPILELQPRYWQHCVLHLLNVLHCILTPRDTTLLEPQLDFK